jgi:hypothetical protein
MGKIDKGILGGFSGTVGTVVGGTWKGIAYMRSKASGSRSASSPLQLDQQARFSTTIKFLQPMTSLLNVSFREYAVKMTGINNAMSYTLKNAISGTYPAYTVDYSMALVSRGDLPNAMAPAATTTGTDVLYTWTPNAGVGKAGATDKAILAVYCAARQQCIFTTIGPDRSTGAATLDVTPFAGQTVQTYIGFITADGRDISNSFYTGELTIS